MQKAGEVLPGVKFVGLGLFSPLYFRGGVTHLFK